MSSEYKPNKDRGASLLTAMRKSIAPYLPPPILRLIHAVDVNFHRAREGGGTMFANNDYFNEEPSMSIMITLLFAYVVYASTRGMWTYTTRRSTAHLGGEEADGVLGRVKGGGRQHSSSSSSSKGGGERHVQPSFRETVVVCGARDSGKTALLHRLCDAAAAGGEGKESYGSSWDPPTTVTSLSANVGYICPRYDATGESNGNNGRENMAMRIIDYPGHPSLLSQLTTLLLPSATSRVVFTLDATQSITEGAALLYRYILIHPQVRQSWSKAGRTLMILVVCTKSDSFGAKNYKRMKIQLRNELDKLRMVDLAITDSSNATNGDSDINDGSEIKFNVKGKSVDLDNLGSDVPVALHFVESGFGKGVEAIREFILNGLLPGTK